MAEERVQRRLAAILAADVVGYSRLMGEDEAGTRARFNTHLHELIEPIRGDEVWVSATAARAGETGRWRRRLLDGMEVGLADAPRANEILVVIAVTDSGRPFPRVGGLTTGEMKGEDGLR